MATKSGMGIHVPKPKELAITLPLDVVAQVVSFMEGCSDPVNGPDYAALLLLRREVAQVLAAAGTPVPYVGQLFKVTGRDEDGAAQDQD